MNGMLKPLFLGLMVLLFCGCTANDASAEERAPTQDQIISQQQSAEEKEEIERALESALPRIYTNYGDSENYSLIKDEQTLAIFHLSRAKLALYMCMGCDEQYKLGMEKAISSLWYESEGTYNEAEYRLALLEDRNTTEERALMLSWAVASRENATNGYESLLRDYPEYAADIDAANRLEAVKARIEINKRELG